ncbi:MAG: MBL fold metallo-hydrolase [Cryobacterium sp.]|uniref:MBL fold metallo-hydrolase n=1 Tax=unclassified Cryobacterium TaxID=2649013 RepID=UPI0018C91D11|nr:MULTISPECIES: MBL fold metallo-hydrolase [unclassified Cryobacterium]MCY7405627.1 MBL fold metallo-hydrolase [Cryobacterium sp.]MEC5154479.1 glyoxylase-like metal-dependent hydrolase (beta-lactamase superfamily II) [Cryobacterium sp. CAN_C3]
MPDDIAPQRTSTLTRSLLAPNAGPMTLDGTNSYLIGARGARSIVVVDPGPLDAGHLATLAASGRVELVLVTHWHADHTAASVRFGALTGAPVRAFDAQFCVGGDPLVDGELVRAAGTGIRIMATPGHTDDSICVHLPADGPTGSVLTGDTILGRGTSIIDGTLADYLASLEALRALGPATVLPAHGPVLPDLAAICTAYLAHRHERLDQVRAALATLGVDASVGQVTDVVYARTDAAVRFAAEASVRAQLAYLRTAH